MKAPASATEVTTRPSLRVIGSESLRDQGTTLERQFPFSGLATEDTGGLLTKPTPAHSGQVTGSSLPFFVINSSAPNKDRPVP
ncbi:hypothetical protein SAMN05519103_09593 [Rhizobiales bacterium GAS113]|nr:hypothetical protein SAMN05519103_09593 [Rhizobiales bacterium GAS113]